MHQPAESLTRAFVTGVGWSAGWRVGGMLVDGIVSFASESAAKISKPEPTSNNLPMLPFLESTPRLQVPPQVKEKNYEEVSVVYNLPIPADGRIIISLYRSRESPVKNQIFVRFSRNHPVGVSIHLLDAMGYSNYQDSRQQSNLRLFDSPVDEDVIESFISEECFTKLELYRHNFIGIFGLCKGGSLEITEIQKLIYKCGYNCCDIIWQNQTKAKSDIQQLPPAYHK